MCHSAEELDAGLLGAAALGTATVIEELLDGPEVSLFALCDGRRAVPIGSAQDFKRAEDGDAGPNTGGMRAYSPVPWFGGDAAAEAVRLVHEPLLTELAHRGLAFSGCLYAGLMLTPDGPKVLEYNCRFGDPECQPVLMRLKSDLLDLIEASLDDTLDEAALRLEWDPRPAVCVVMASGGYPGPFEKGHLISGLGKVAAMEDVKVFHAGTAMSGGRLVASGGRVLNVTARGATIAEAKARAYAAVDVIDWPGGFCRRDIGWRAVQNREL